MVELQQLVDRYVGAGLYEAAASLMKQGAELRDMGELPYSLVPSSQNMLTPDGHFESSYPRPIDPDEQSIAVRLRYEIHGRGNDLFLWPHHYDEEWSPSPDDHYEIDALGLREDVRLTLLSSGIHTLAETKFFLKYGLFLYVTNRRIERDISDALDKHPTRRDV